MSENRRRRENRIKNTVSEFSGAVNDLMIFMMLYYRIDVTPKAIKRNDFLFNSIVNGTPKEASFWSEVVEFVNNPYTTATQVETAFSHIRRKVGIEKSRSCKNEDFKLYVSARQITQVALKFGANLYREQEKYSKAFAKISSDYGDFDFSQYTEYPYLELIKLLEKEFEVNPAIEV